MKHFFAPALIAAILVILPATEAGETRQLLSSHDTIAEFKEIKFRTCMGRTSLCPEQCGDSGEYATFQIITYLAYQKPGEYGDPKQETFLIQISDFHKKAKGDPKIAELVKSLQPGDTVHLMWNHDYVSREGGKFPERPLMLLKEIDDAEKARLLESAQAPAKP